MFKKPLLGSLAFSFGGHAAERLCALPGKNILVDLVKKPNEILLKFYSSAMEWLL